MQGLEAKNYTGTLNCFTSVVKNDGVLALWKGTTPRLGRVMFSGGIIFACTVAHPLSTTSSSPSRSYASSLSAQATRRLSRRWLPCGPTLNSGRLLASGTLIYTVPDCNSTAIPGPSASRYLVGAPVYCTTSYLCRIGQGGRGVRADQASAPSAACDRGGHGVRH